MERIEHLIAAATGLRFPPGSARLAVAQHGDRWLADMPAAIQHGVEALAEVDQAAISSGAWRRSTLVAEMRVADLLTIVRQTRRELAL